jgi:hypothetical protein
MVDFPSSKKTFSQIVDGTNYTEATQMNQAYDEIEALETLIGSLGRAQTYSASLKALLNGYRNGCLVEYKGVADLYVRSGSVYIPDASGNAAFRLNTSDTTVTWSDIDTGSEANSTVYYVYAVADSAATAFTVKVSTNATTPTGCTYYKLIGTFYNNSSGDIIEIGNSPNKLLGNWISRTAGTTYLALTDGFFQATAEGSGSAGSLTAYSDSSNPPTTIRGQSTFDSGKVGNVFSPVKKGDYYKVAITGGAAIDAYFFISFS